MAFIHPEFDPIALHLGPLAIRWYGLMYLVGFVAFVILARSRIRRADYVQAGWQARDIDDLLFYGLFGVIAGGRLGYVLFYKPEFYLTHPLDAFMLWHGGMSFHGGFLGVLVAAALWARRHGVTFFQVMDLVAPCIPPGLAAGRLGNFINGELWGRPTDVPWAMIFPQVDALPRHPSQLYQFAGEGIGLFILLWVYSRQPRATGMVSAMFLLGYGVFRFLAEFGREPDDFLGLLAGGLSMGQWLSLPMIIGGVVLALLAQRGAFKASAILLRRQQA